MFAARERVPTGAFLPRLYSANLLTAERYAYFHNSPLADLGGFFIHNI
jgi:hypothetical protein